MEDNDIIDTDMNATLWNGDVISGIGLTNIPNPPQDKKSSKLNKMNMSVDNGDVNSDYCYMNGYTGSVINNHNYIYYTKKRDEISTNRHLRENKSPRGLRVKTDILVSINGSAPGSSLHFKNLENILEGVYKRVLGTRGSTTTSLTLYLHATGYWPISHAAPLGETPLA